MEETVYQCVITVEIFGVSIVVIKEEEWRRGGGKEWRRGEGVR